MATPEGKLVGNYRMRVRSGRDVVEKTVAVYLDGDKYSILAEDGSVAVMSTAEVSFGPEGMAFPEHVFRKPALKPAAA
jgi:hypothetical protein